LPDESYGTGEPLEKLTVAVQWADPAANGLRLGLAGHGKGDTWAFGSEHALEIYLRNDGNEPVKFSWTPRADEGLNLLRAYLEKYPSLDALNVVFQATLEQHGAEPAYKLARDELRRTPTLLGVDKLLEAQLLEAPLDRRRDLELIRGLVNQHTQGLAMYKCDNCGFRARQYYWHCPACASWETYSPRRTEEKGVPA